MEEKITNIELTERDIELLNSKSGLIELMQNKEIKVDRVLKRLHYYDKLLTYQAELIKLQKWVVAYKKRVAILFEGRDAAGKGGAIRRFIEHMNPRSLRVVALPSPTPVEQGQWYFQRYIQQLPNPGEIVFFDRSWYNRAVVEPVNAFCTNQEYEQFMEQVVDFEHMLHTDGIQVIKIWFSISREEQIKRFENIRNDPLKHWKMSPVDDKAIELWDEYSRYRREMFGKTNMEYCPWAIVKANSKTKARVEAIKYVLDMVDYPKDDKAMEKIKLDSEVMRQLNQGEVDFTTT
ncbi:MAG: polyphosphate kinase 2 [Bacteroidota bacterium]